MSVSNIAALLNQRFGFTFDQEQVLETGRTADSTLYTASNESGQAVEVELFAATPGPDAADVVGALNTALAEASHPGVFQPRGAGLTDGGHLFVLREAPTGTPLRQLLGEKQAVGSAFTKTEARDLLQPVAEAIDAYNREGHADFVARSITPDHLLVQPAWSSTPVKMALVGPAPSLSDATGSAERNRADFRDLVAELTGTPVDAELAGESGSCAGYLLALAGGAASAVEDQGPLTSVAPRPQDGYRKPPEPYAYGPTGEYKRPAVVKSKMNPWPWIIAVLVLLLIALGAFWWWWDNSRGAQWEGADAEIAEAYPQLVSGSSGQKGWEDLQCESATPEQGQEGKIRCANQDLGVSVSKYVSQDARDEVVPGRDEAVILGSGECMIDSYEVPDAYPPAFVMVPENKEQFMVVINGHEAEEKRLALPMCE
ncbi:hypothetical protein CKJ81_10360 [Corynebacterium hadale]|uniref:Serine/threonine protein kinase n=1 Tax=Corynebacterium hadale TaxID=2026255 RepID=A0ABX4H7J9_9CORY|nr:MULTISPECIES: hypothetical protein [Corynebacterium]MCG7254756.1 hypothetical protein [Corynebacterium hadale]MCG7257105.1 hypothetical protein [Corynebacterium hadale]MCG7265636.1 hypothetical protein [Corynebacterium hadale]PAT05254.1 hypothetical protein CKJ81_10360 [Corynebacterium hadale]PAT14426.1 hypothetical protein CKJ84_08900 [Corynebacterium sp. NML 120412]